MLLIYLLLLFVCLISFTMNADDHIFTVPDLSLDYNRTLSNEIIHLNAFKTIRNDEILAKNDSSRHSQLQWVSIGSPRLVMIPSFNKMSNTTMASLVEFKSESFSLKFTMLTDVDKWQLQKEVKRRKNIDVSMESFINVKPEHVVCMIEIYDQDLDQSFQLKGQVYDFRRSPYELRFKYKRNSLERLAFQKRLNDSTSLSDHMDIDCNVKAGAKTQKVNTFILTLQQINELKSQMCS